MEKSAERKKDEMYMRRCIQLARNGISGAAPNPMVGAVVVCDDRIIGEGYHQRCGGPHAEVNAIASVKEPELLQHSTIYVSLEPCAHYGKTPPCADLIISKHIPRAVVGCQDSFTKVDGVGIRKLRDAGTDVVVGVLEEECRRLNEKFFVRHTKGRPYVTLKWAQSADGFVDKFRNTGAQGKAVKFSTPTTQALVHRLRAHHGAILVGARTAMLDNPTLTVRHWSGQSPLRLVLDPRGALPADLHLFDGSVPTCAYVLADCTPAYADKVEVVRLREDNVLKQIMDDLVARDVQSLLVEGGASTLQAFIDGRLWDEARVETAPLQLNEGVGSPKLTHCRMVSEETVDGNQIQNFRPEM